MGLLKQWRDVAYSQQADKAKLQKFWAEYFVIEKGIYEQLLADKDTVVSGTAAFQSGRSSTWNGKGTGR